MINKIIELFVLMYRKLIYIYEKSFVNRVINRLFGSIGKKTGESYFGGKFIVRKDRTYLQKSSIFFKIILTPMIWIKSKITCILNKSTSLTDGSIFLKPLNTLLNMLLNICTKFWGIILISLSMFLTIFYVLARVLLSKSFVIENVIITSGILTLGVILYFINKSTQNLADGSILITKAKKLIFTIILDKEVHEASQEFENTDAGLNTKNNTNSNMDPSINSTIYPSNKLSLLIGFIVAVLCVISSPLAIIITIIGIIGVALIIKETIIGVFLVVGLAPVLPTMATLGLVAITVVSFILRCLLDKKMKFKITELGLSIILLVAIFAYSMVTSFSAKSDLNIFLLTSIFILFYFVFINIVHSKRQLYSLISFMLVVAFFVALYGIYQNYTGGASNLWTDQEMFGDIQGRVTSTLANPNVLGEYLILFIPLCIAMINIKKNIFNRFVYTGITVTLFACLIFTYSRGCWLGILLGLVIFFVCADRKFIVVGIIGLLTLPALLPQSIINRFTSIGNLADTSSSYRLSIWIGAVNMLKDYWYSGIGLGEEAFKSVFSYYSYNGVIALHPHNLYLQLITQLGIIGFIVFLVIIIKFYRLSIIELLKTKSKEYHILIIAIVSGISAFMLQSMFDNTWFNYRIILIFITTIAIGIKIVMLSRDEKSKIEDAVL